MKECHGRVFLWLSYFQVGGTVGSAWVAALGELTLTRYVELWKMLRWQELVRVLLSRGSAKFGG